jgi:hypothetical protein
MIVFSSLTDEASLRRLSCNSSDLNEKSLSILERPILPFLCFPFAPRDTIYCGGGRGGGSQDDDFTIVEVKTFFGNSQLTKESSRRH